MPIDTLIPNEPQPGQPCSAKWGQAVIRVLRALVPHESATLQLNWGSSGYFYTVRSRQTRRIDGQSEGELKFLFPVVTSLKEGTAFKPAWSLTNGRINDSEVKMPNGKTIGKDPKTDKGSDDPADWAMALSGTKCRIYLAVDRKTDASATPVDSFENYRVVVKEGDAEPPKSTAKTGYSFRGEIEKEGDQAGNGKWTVTFGLKTNVWCICTGEYWEFYNAV